MSSNAPFFKAFGPLIFGRPGRRTLQKLSRLNSLQELYEIFFAHSQAPLGNALGSEAALRRAGVSVGRPRLTDPQNPPSMRSKTSLRKGVPKPSSGTSETATITTVAAPPSLRLGSLGASALPKMPLILLIALIVFVSPADAAPLIVVDQASPEIFPGEWRGAPVEAQAEILPESDRAMCREIIEKEMANYPAAILDANLKEVYVLSRLRYHGVFAGGTNSRSGVYLVKNGRFTPALFVNNFHAEFSSILLRNHPGHLDNAAWQKNNPEGFVYLGSGVQAVREKKASIHPSDALHEQGFFSEYSKASIEEDFNSHAARLFTGDKELWSAIERFPRIKAKTELAMLFYQKLDASFTRDFFASRRKLQTK